MFCANCGAENPEGSVFCSSCGANVYGPAAAAAEVQQPAQGGTAVKKSNKKLITVVVGAVLLLALVILLVSVMGGSGGGASGLKKSDIVGQWYKEDSETSRKVFSFTDDGRLLIRGEAGDFFVGEPRGTLCGEWEIFGENSISISYDNAESQLADVYFGAGGLANVELAEDGSGITFYVDSVNGSKFTLKKYPGTE